MPISFSNTRFSEVFLIDSSTAQTLDSDLKNIALVKGVGESASDAIEWLARQHEEWLLLFDNADDITLNLQKYFPSCSHGNILITSRNQETCVHALQFNYKVSDMIPKDATDLLLCMANWKVTGETQLLAAAIVKVHL